MAEIKDFVNMCSAHIDCEGCPFEKVGVCSVFVYKHTAEADRIITEWCKEHPQKTYAMDFFERFPNARKTKSGRPDNCRNLIYGDKPDCNCECEECWNQKI